MPVKRQKKSTRKPSSRKKSSKKLVSSKFGRLVKKTFLYSLVFGTLFLSLYTIYLNSVIKEKFEGRRWAMPAKVYARSLEFSPGLVISARQLETE